MTKNILLALGIRLLIRICVITGILCVLVETPTKSTTPKRILWSRRWSGSTIRNPVPKNWRSSFSRLAFLDLKFINARGRILFSMIFSTYISLQVEINRVILGHKRTKVIWTGAILLHRVYEVDVLVIFYFIYPWSHQNLYKLEGEWSFRLQLLFFCLFYSCFSW